MDHPSHTLKTVFPDRRHAILPVIHAESEDQCLRNTSIALQAGTDGVFLINHSISEEDLLRIAGKVRREFPSAWIGVNCLGLLPAEVFGLVDETVNGIWVDNALVDEEAEAQVEAEEVLRARERSGWRGLYFGGVAFKYQRPVEDLESAARIAARYMDVITTSGPGTGRAALPEKIARMKRALGDQPLAIASGITPENVTDYLPNADAFLVATGIGASFTELAPARVAALVRTVRGLR